MGLGFLSLVLITPFGKVLLVQVEEVPLGVYESNEKIEIKNTDQQI